jgi:lipopolysaccharide/colanic/teichoic acid biosynthesis glycosyltransferase
MYRTGTIESATRVLGCSPKKSRPSAPTERNLDLARALDILIALTALWFFAPLMLVLAFAIKAQDGGPVTFGHSRIGRDGRTFKCLKFRSMVVDAETRLQNLLAADAMARAEWEVDHKLRRDPRVTRLGYMLRKSSLDELPQLINVLRGEMSIVGPRPIVAAEIARYGRSFRYYKAVKPGITGLWQTSGRSNVSYRRRVAMDVLYAKRRSAGLYLHILLKTIPAVLLSEGSY